MKNKVARQKNVQRGIFCQLNQHLVTVWFGQRLWVESFVYNWCSAKNKTCILHCINAKQNDRDLPILKDAFNFIFYNHRKLFCPTSASLHHKFAKSELALTVWKI